MDGLEVGDVVELDLRVQRPRHEPRVAVGEAQARHGLVVRGQCLEGPPRSGEQVPDLDLVAAGRDEERVVDFDALSTTCVSWLAAGDMKSKCTGGEDDRRRTSKEARKTR